MDYLSDFVSLSKIQSIYFLRSVHESLREYRQKIIEPKSFRSCC